ncbi:MAG: family 78 glycoside hydrolase catalytic domain [Verrucomicrobia bacterium]|nr:family 78 glycoside hydrolase catalytic domain [Verrucomicrobiota bacterium]
MKKQIIAILLTFLPAAAGLAAPVHLVDEAPVEIRTVAPGVFLVDFGRVAFGNLRLMPPAGASQEIKVHLGEAFTQGRINRKPPGSVRYASIPLVLDGAKPLVAAPLADARNTKQPAAVLTPAEWGVVLPFRWVEIEGWPGELQAENLRRQAAYASTWDDHASAFTSSDEMLNRIWELCRYSIKATTFAGIYVDGDRERIPYEADAYLNQLSHYATDNDIQMARDTYDHLMKRPTWPTEWASHMIFMAHADYLHTGDTAWLAPRYPKLKTKLRLDQARADGLLVSTPAQIKRNDIVDWPTGERDGYVFTPVNTVVNAFHLRALQLMAELAKALNHTDDAAAYAAEADRARLAFQAVLFDPAKGLYRDGEGTDHTSQHANLFPLAFGLVPPEHQAQVTNWVAARGMRCSVYAAQYLLEGLFDHGAATQALELITAPGNRSWRHMVDSGTTITWEAWDQKYKSNQDWNHAWGAAPANIIPRKVMGVEPLHPGYSRIKIAPKPGTLTWARAKVPTPKGPVLVEFKTAPDFALTVEIPAGMTAVLSLPLPASAAPGNARLVCNGKPLPATAKDGRLLADQPVGPGRYEIKAVAR